MDAKVPEEKGYPEGKVAEEKGYVQEEGLEETEIDEGEEESETDEETALFRRYREWESSQRSNPRGLAPRSSQPAPPPRPRTSAVHYNHSSGRWTCDSCGICVSPKRTV